MIQINISHTTLHVGDLPTVSNWIHTCKCTVSSDFDKIIFLEIIVLFQQVIMRHDIINIMIISCTYYQTK